MKIMSSKEIWRLLWQSKVEFAPDPRLTELALKSLYDEGVTDEEMSALGAAGYIVLADPTAPTGWELTPEAEYQLLILHSKEMAEIREILDILDTLESQ